MCVLGFGKINATALAMILCLSVSLCVAQDYDEHIRFPKEKLQHYDKQFRKEQRKEKERRGQVIKFAPLALIMGQIPYAAELRLLYEVAIGPRQSLFAGASFNFQNFLTQAIWDSINSQGYNFQDVYGYRVQGGYKYFPVPSNIAPRGLFIGPHVSYNTLTARDRDYPDDRLRFIYFNVNFLGGYQLIAGRFVLEAVSGIGYKRNSVEYYTGGVKTDQEVIHFIKPTVTMNLGINF
ncbi:MAG: hypothetical protein KatS3mg031_1298 [Chitinophagales bacterium]|nr:MAG: hypothetical protein KatS3mg031_1298 [Chitinophagales bacterium]